MIRILTLLLCGLVATSVSAEVLLPGSMTFEPLQSNGTGFVSPGDVYEEDGLRVTALRSEFASPETNNTNWFAGSTGLFNTYAGGVTRLTNLENTPFNLTSIDLSRVSLDLYPGGATVTFVGTHSDLSTAIQSFTVGEALAFQTFYFGPDFVNVLYVDWAQDYPYHQFDNISVNGVPPDPTAVPEPMTLAVWSVFALGGAGLAARRRTRRESRG